MEFDFNAFITEVNEQVTQILQGLTPNWSKENINLFGTCVTLVTGDALQRMTSYTDYSKINYKDYRTVDRNNKRMCCICLEPMTDFSMQLICGHDFHSQCLVPWMSGKHTGKHTCPLCRMDHAAFSLAAKETSG